MNGMDELVAFPERLVDLRQLGLQLAAVMRDGRVQLVPGTAVAATHAALARMDAEIADHQATHQATQMGRGVVRLDVLAAEIEFFQARYAEHAPIVRAAERSASTAWDGDTQGIATADAPDDRGLHE